MIASKGQSPALWTLQSTTFFTGTPLIELFFFKQQKLGQVIATGTHILNVTSETEAFLFAI